MNKYGIDATIISSQKGLCLSAGLSFLSFSERMLERINQTEKVSSKYFFASLEGVFLINKTRDEILDNYGILKCDIDCFDKIAAELNQPDVPQPIHPNFQQGRRNLQFVC